MNACIITIGNEIIAGSRLDTNSQWISRKIAKHNITTERIISIGDNNKKISNEIKNCIDKYNFIFITGGLGPTHDDITLNTFQKVFNLKSKVDSQYLKKLNKMFKDRNMKMPDINKEQALVLKNTNILKNSIGTARGLHYNHSKSNFFIMPGVPSEMCQMIEKEIIPKYLNSQINNSSKTIRTSGIAESKLSEKLTNSMAVHDKDYRFSFLPSYKGVDFGA